MSVVENTMRNLVFIASLLGVSGATTCTDVRVVYQHDGCCDDSSGSITHNAESKLLIRKDGSGPRLWIPGKAVLFNWNDPYGNGAYLNFIGKKNGFEYFYAHYDAPLPTEWYGKGFEMAGANGMGMGTVVHPPAGKLTGHFTWVNTTDANYDMQYYAMIDGWFPTSDCLPNDPSVLNLASTTPACMPISDGTTPGWLYGGPNWEYGPLVMSRGVSGAALLTGLMRVM